VFGTESAMTSSCESLFHASRKVGRITLVGFLVNAANKSGIAIQCDTGKPAFISSKDTVLTGRIPPQLHVVSAFPSHEKNRNLYATGGIANLEGPTRSALRM
jgi:hypothetical protein